ncbi:MAG TPA: FKBP-type peptidyl-prolyl cis-trans isomerase [Bacteroidales bacterium]|nr:FKBP-type peptidyl-prolyl cis-trans isomerase [Bacteroidales bacterium]
MAKHYLQLLTLLALVTFYSCSKSEYPGYTKNENGFHYKLIKIGDDSVKCRYNDYITADICYRTLNDSLFFKGRRKFQISQPTFPGSIDECLTLLGTDDSASFIIPAKNFFVNTLSSELPAFLSETDQMKVDVNIIEIQTPMAFAYEKQAFLKWIEDFGEYEKTILQQYLDESKLKINPTQSGMRYLTLRKGNDRGVNLGDTVVVHYEGKFLNGKFFDSTRKRNEAFQFVYGQQWQVIKGIEEGIGLMHEGEKALFILPSEMAFGESGSSTGIIPPFTSLIFEVELLSVK